MLKTVVAFSVRVLCLPKTLIKCMKNCTQVFVEADYSGSCQNSATGLNISDCLWKLDLESISLTFYEQYLRWKCENLYFDAYVTQQPVQSFNSYSLNYVVKFKLKRWFTLTESFLSYLHQMIALLYFLTFGLVTDPLP